MNDYYVYMHKRKDNGLIFYVGKGRNNRCNVKTHRNKDWFRVVTEAGGFVSEFIHTGLTSDEAEEQEHTYLNNQKDEWKLVNKKLSTKVIPLNAELLSEYFEYSKDSPSGLLWKKDIFCGEFYNVLTARKNTQAGNRMFNKTTKKAIAWQVRLNYKTYLVHRIIYTIMVGDITKGLVINHIDNNPYNNDLINLEMCTLAENSRRSFQQSQGLVKSNNTTGFIGVSLTKPANGSMPLYVAGYKDLDGKLQRKFFSTSKLGAPEAFRLACLWRKEQIRLLNLQGAGYPESFTK